MADCGLPNPSYLSTFIRYEPDTGLLFWVECPEKGMAWNAIRPGKQACQHHKDGYRRIRIGRVAFAAHRLAWAMYHGEWPLLGIDHIDGNPSNNKIGNLRDVTQAVNARNTKLYSTNTSGKAGVCLKKGKWVAQIMFNGKNMSIGSFENFEDAVEARRNVERKLGFTSRS